MGPKTRAGDDLDDIRAAIDGRLAELRDEEARLTAAREALTSGKHAPTAGTNAEHERPHKQLPAETRGGDPADDRDGDVEPGDARLERAPSATPRARSRPDDREPPLTIELVPLTCWQTNVRSAVPRQVWGQLRQRVYADADNRCEVCGGRGTRPALHCHEVWEYDDERHVQRLARMVALCPPCHAVKHIGRSAGFGYGSDALRQLANVNDWTPDQASAYAEAAFEQWHERSTHEWTLDLDGLRAYGIDPTTVQLPSAADRAALIRQRLPGGGRDTSSRGPRAASPQLDAETGAEFWLCDNCGLRGDAVLENVAADDAPNAVQEFLRQAPGRFKNEVTLVLPPPGWTRRGGRLICGSCAATAPSS